MENKFIKLLESPYCKQVNAALLYSEMLTTSAYSEIDWPKVNHAITSKWSAGGLKKVKTMAWQLIEGSHLRLEL